MRKLTIIIILTAAALGLRGLAPVQAALPAPQPAGASFSAAMLRLEYDWQRLVCGRVLHTFVRGLVTAIGPHTLLTHNHYPAGFGALASENLTLTDASGRTVTVPQAAVSLQPIDAGTLLIQLPRDIRLVPAPLGSDSDVLAVAPGDWLTVQYWDDEPGQLTLSEFQVVAVNPGVATLADPARRINGGDSGGGVFRAGRLVGNTWSIDTDPAGRPLGYIHVALLPAEVSGGASGLHRPTAAAQPLVDVLNGLIPAAQ
jgi:hypothetical protein